MKFTTKFIYILAIIVLIFLPLEICNATEEESATEEEITTEDTTITEEVVSTEEETTTEEVVYGYTVRYYKNNISKKNLLGSYFTEGDPGDFIDITCINLNAYKPANSSKLKWTNGYVKSGYSEYIDPNSPNIINIIYAVTYCNVTCLGANGYDETDDTKAIQTALNYANKNRNDTNYTTTVFIPDGTYYISKALFIQSNTTLKLSNDATIIRSKKALGKNMLRNTNLHHNSSKAKGYNLSQNITIMGGHWNGGKISKAKSQCNLIYVGHAKNVTIKNTNICNCYGAHAIEFAGVQKGNIKNCKISGFRYGRDKFTSEAIQLDICYKSKKEGAWTPGFALDKTPCKNITIEKCLITDYPRGIGIHHSLKKFKCSNIKIRNNIFKRSSPSKKNKNVVGIYALGVRNIKITNNIFDHYSYGAMLKASSHYVIKKNQFKYNNSCALMIDGCDRQNAYRNFKIEQKNTIEDAANQKDEKDTKELTFSCPYIRCGKVIIGHQKYKFNSSKDKKTIKLRKSLNNNTKITFYGVDSWENKYYQTRKFKKK